MRRFVLLLSLTIFVQSCITQQKCKERYPPLRAIKDSTHVHDSVSITYLPFIIPRDSVVIRDSVPCGDFKLNVKSKDNNITASISIKNGILEAKFLQDSLRAMLEHKDRIITTLESNKNTEVVIQKEYIDHWYTPFCNWFTLIGLLLIAIVGGAKIGKII